MKARVVTLEGNKAAEIELPRQFRQKIDAELIKRAVLAVQSASAQPSSPMRLAGRDNTADYIGSRHKPNIHRTINVGHARKPRLKNRRGIISGRVASIPAVVGGPRAHPPKPEKVNAEKINEKERRKAVDSAVSATADKKLVKERGHSFADAVDFPVVVEKKFEELDKTRNVREALKKIGLWIDVERALSKRKARAGIGKKRGRKYKKRKSILIVAKDTKNIYKGARNLEGVDVVRASDLNANLLAPGALPGRLTLWTEGAIMEMSEAKKTAEAKAA